MTPAFTAVIFVKYRHGVRWPTVLNQLLQRVLASIHTGRTLHRVYAADEVQSINDQ
jgi:hypothetical protein